MIGYFASYNVQEKIHIFEFTKVSVGRRGGSGKPCSTGVNMVHCNKNYDIILASNNIPILFGRLPLSLIFLASLLVNSCGD